MNKDVVSLSIAKKLKEAGWKQEVHCGCDNELLCGHPHKLHYGNLDTEPDFTLCRYVRKYKAYGRGYYAAPTIGELLEALPQKVKVKEGQWSILHLQRNTPSNWEAFYNFAHIGRQNNPADALALLWMALKEKGLITT